MKSIQVYFQLHMLYGALNMGHIESKLLTGFFKVLAGPHDSCSS